MNETETMQTSRMSMSPDRRRLLLRTVDLLVALALGIIAFGFRRHVPSDGLFYDDAWQGLGAAKATFSNFFTAGQTQPGFTLGLAVWTRAFGSGTTALVTPALIAGSLGPPALYLGLRRFRCAPSVSLLVASCVVAAETHIAYSSHVKTYTWDVLIVLLVALVVRRLAPLRWNRSIAVWWILGSLVIGAFSSIALVAAGAAGAILVLHPKGDVRVRLASVGTEFVGLLVIFGITSRTYSSAQIRAFFAQRGGFIYVKSSPAHVARELFDAFWNVAQVFPGGRPSLSLFVALLGLAYAAWRGPLAVPARFFVLMLVIAVAGAVAHQVPFGPPIQLGRVSLWLIPVMGVGIGMSLQFLRRLVERRGPLRMGFDAIVVVASVAILLSAIGTKYAYPAGAREATLQVMGELGPHDSVIVTRPTTYSFALYAHTGVSLKATPDRAIGFLPVFTDQRLHAHDFTTTEAELDGFVKGANRVFVVNAVVDPNGYRAYLLKLAKDLHDRGFEQESLVKVDTAQVAIWRRTTG